VVGRKEVNVEDRKQLKGVPDFGFGTRLPTEARFTVREKPKPRAGFDDYLAADRARMGPAGDGGYRPSGKRGNDQILRIKIEAHGIWKPFISVQNLHGKGK